MPTPHPAHPDVVEDSTGILAGPDHMADMERLPMVVCQVTRPYPTVARVLGQIAPRTPAAWSVPNTAVRLEVESPPGLRPISRVYTIRRYDPALRQVEIDFVLHEDDSPAMRWLRAARPGDAVWMTGPRAHLLPDFDAPRVALFADDTAIPALFAILAAWPEGRDGAVWIDSPSPEAVAELPRPAGVTITHLQAGARQAMPQATPLAAAAQAALTGPGWSVWAGGERQDMRALRAQCRGLGLPRQSMQIMGYWRRGVSSSDIDRLRLAALVARQAEGQGMEALDDDDLAL